MPDDPISPAARERDRLLRAERVAVKYCDDLAELCGRPERDDLTRDIYRAARRAGEGADSGPDPQWVTDAKRALTRLEQELPETVRERVRRVVQYKVDDPDVVVCLEYADDFFAPHEVDNLVRRRLAACLLDYAFDKAQKVQKMPTTAIARVERPFSAELVEMKSHLMLGRTLRVGGTVVAGIGIFMTGQLWLFSMLFVVWLASWMLIDKKAIERQAALEAALEPKQLPASSGGEGSD